MRRHLPWVCGFVAGLVALPAGAEPGAPLWREARPANGPSVPLATLVARARPAIVQVRGHLVGRAARATGGRLSVGTGFVISPAGYVVTNEHVIREAEELQLRLFDGREVSACVAGVDVTTDIALLKARAPGALPTLPLGNPADTRAGDDVFVIGSPFGFDHSVSAGILSAKDRIVERPGATDGQAAAPYAFYLQTDAAINMGNSGGPMLSRTGAVIGVASAYWGGAQPAQGIGFAIPIDVVKRLLPQLMRDGRVTRSRVGVDVQAVDPLLAQAFRLDSTRGALLAALDPAGPAATADLRAGDVVLTWDEHDVTGVEDFKIYAQLTPPAHKVVVKALREGKVIKATLQLIAAVSSSAPRHPAGCNLEAQADLPALALDVAAQPGKEGGLIVRNVGAGAGREAGLLPGDVIVQVGGTPVASVEELRRALGAANVPRAVLVKREQSSFWVALPPHRPAP